MQTTLNNAVLLSDRSYRDRVMGCWLGKAVGGTLGMPFEGQDGPLNLHFYEPAPTEMLPNDDLDLQVVWACVLDKLEDVRVDRHILAQAWLDHVGFPWDEYGAAIRNLKNGLRPPLSGSYDNWYINGMGAPIRSEVWACLAPGNPDLAASYAYEDACVDHAEEGIWGEVFFAALESAAFVTHDPDTLLDTVLPLLPEGSRVGKAIGDTRAWWAELRDWRLVRERILARHGDENFTDAPMNVAFTVLGWLASEGDFSEAICTAVNCGKDTDCTGATVGALMGIIDPGCISGKWLRPIGANLVLSPQIIGLNPPSTLEGFTEMVVNIGRRLNGRPPNARHYDQSAAYLAVSAEAAFVSELPLGPEVPRLSEPTSIRLPGTIGRLAREDFKQEILLLRYVFDVPETGRVVVLFNTSEECRVWVDGDFAFSRAGGSMAPSFHRAPANQHVHLDLLAGRHELTAAVRRPSLNRDVEWVIGIGDAKTSAWLPNAFRQALLPTERVEDAAPDAWSLTSDHAGSAA